MLHENILINIDYDALGIQHDDSVPVLTTYILNQLKDIQGERRRPCILICPGGGYGHLAEREAEPIAIRMNSYGLNACVLRYSLLPNGYPCPMYEAAYAVKYIRDHSQEWGIDPDKIIIAGFSAGGHVAASVGTLWNQDEFADFTKNYLKCEPSYIRPDGMLLGYSVLTSGEKAHKMSFVRLLGDRHDELLDKVSLEKRVNEGTPKTFMWHTFSDESVPMENSLLFANALRENNIPFELHIFPKGNHGLGLGSKETDVKEGTKYQPECSVWPDMFKTWLENTVGPIYE